MLIAALVLAVSSPTFAATFQFPEHSLSDPAALSDAIHVLAHELLAEQPAPSISDKFLLQLAARQYAEAAAGSAIASRNQSATASGPVYRSVPLELYAKAKAWEASGALPFDEAFKKAYAQVFAAFDDRAALDASWFLGTPPSFFENQLQQKLSQNKGRTDLPTSDAMDLIAAYLTRDAFRSMAPLLPDAVAADDSNRYVIEERTLIKTMDGATLSAVVVRSKGTKGRQPASLWFNIYVNLAISSYEAKQAAVHGYVGIAADPRGKRLSPDRIAPWETEVKDTYAVIDWISKQPWSDGQVGMYGHSHGGFAAWAATKHLHPALKTIVASAASQPGFGLPMQNNVFQFAQYAWPFYVMNNKYTDDATYFDRDRWRRLQHKWFESGKPYRVLDALDGMPNPLLQKQLQHPSFDEYYQSMQPYRQDYAKIDIPVLSVTGYFDDANASAVNYFREHYKYNPDAKHFLVIGPYDHVATARAYKPPTVRGYTIDPSAQLDSVALTYEWFDHVMRDGPKPRLLQDRVNYQVMGADLWRHAPSIERMSNENLTLYLTNLKLGEHHVLARESPSRVGFLEQTVDFADRTTENNLYPTGVITEAIDLSDGFAFVSEPFPEPVSFDGQLSGVLNATINKRDMDFTLALYELMPNGRLFNLSYYLGRASYAEDMTKRKLLTPGKLARLPFDRTALMSRQLASGSRLLLLLTVNKNKHAQINYGTGKDVSDESMQDAKDPLRVRWHTDSHVNIPLRRSPAAHGSKRPAH